MMDDRQWFKLDDDVELGVVPGMLLDHGRQLVSFSCRFPPAPPAVKILSFCILMFFLIWILLFSGFGQGWLVSVAVCEKLNGLRPSR